MNFMPEAIEKSAELMSGEIESRMPEPQSFLTPIAEAAFGKDRTEYRVG